ncbi:MAG: prepilin-type N-terminal cleavage/methylation domain-containing protein, partial [Calditrichaeota bacterium]|nr:prepilin-type N-terminal cleavage/methylation domain-containing protein [Calditrichota bacterium]
MRRLMQTDGFTLTEILTVLVLIGILSVLAFSKYDRLIANTKTIEAQTQLKTLYEMQKMYHLRFDRYSDKFEEIGFQPSILMSQGGDARYKIEITQANQSG